MSTFEPAFWPDESRELEQSLAESIGSMRAEPGAQGHGSDPGMFGSLAMFY